jgi:uncharacterized protein
MPHRTNKDVVLDAWRAFASRDPVRIGSCFVETAEWIAPAGNATALALQIPSHMIGREAIVRFLCEDFPRLFVSDTSVAFKGIYADGDTVIVEETMKAVLPEGRRYENDYCFVFSLLDGQISNVREYMDTQRGARCIFGDEMSSRRSLGGDQQDTAVPVKPTG